MIRILVTGAESSGTKMMAAMLRQTGAHVDHSSPSYRRNKYTRFPRSAERYDAVVIMVRNWFAQNLSAVNHRHAKDPGHARELALMGISDVVYGLRYGPSLGHTYLATYESIIHEPESLIRLCEEIGLDHTLIREKVVDQNCKYYIEELNKEAG